MSCCWQDGFGWNDSVILLEWITEYSPRQNYGIWLYLNISILLWSLLFLAELCETDDASQRRARIEGTEAYLVYSFGSMLVWVLGAGLHLLDHVYVHHYLAHHPTHTNMDTSKSTLPQGQLEQYCGPEEQRLLKSCIPNNQKNAYNAIDPESDETVHPDDHETNEEEKEERETKRFDLYAILFEFILSIYFLDYSRRAFCKWNTPDDNVADELMDTLINIGAFSYQVVRIWKIRQEDIAMEMAEIILEKKAHDSDVESNDATVIMEHIPSPTIQPTLSQIFILNG